MSLEDPNTYERWYGRPTPPSELRVLHAGPLTVALDGPDLRYVRLRDVELVRRVYVALRDINWETIAGEIERLEVVDAGDAFTVDCWLSHRRGPIDFAWHGRFEGHADGTLSYEMDGRCGASFDYAKIGICVHHPSRESKGRPYTATTPNGTVTGLLPLAIGQQILLVAEGYDKPLFDPCSALTIELEDQVTVGFGFEGSLFEMEDQRNWTDASFKSASTPSCLGARHRGEPERRIHQRVVIRAVAPQARPRWRSPDDRLIVGDPLDRSLPPIGFGLPSDGAPHSNSELARVRELAPAHLRADVHIGDGAVLAAALGECRRAGAALELALFAANADAGAFDRIGAALAGAGVEVARVLVLPASGTTTTAELVSAATTGLAPHLPATPLFGGTNVNFCDVNRDRPDVAALAGIAYSINAQVHAFDERSLVETLEGQADTVRSAREFFADAPVAVTPVTMRPRFNPDLVGEPTPPPPDELPWEVDPRQPSLFCAAWTLGSIKALSEAGAASLTYYETTGWRGLFERDAGPRMPEWFHSRPGKPFPVFDVFRTLRGYADAELLELTPSDPLGFTGLALRTITGLDVLVANLTEQPRTIRIDPTGTEVQLEPFAVAQVQRLR